MNGRLSFSGLLASLLAAALTLLLAASNARAADIIVFAAASLTDALKQIGTQYEKLSSDKIIFNFGSSSMLARQIVEGAPADIFFSADEPRMDALDKQGLILKETRKNRLSNSLVIVIPHDSSLQLGSPADLAGPNVKRIALADPQAVPAGVYSREYLVRQELWSSLEPKVVPTENVRAALAAVESGNVEAGMVFKTDAAISRKVKVACEIPRDAGPKIRYPMAVIKDSNQVEAAKRFVQYLGSNEAAAVFEKCGFIVLD